MDVQSFTVSPTAGAVSVPLTDIVITAKIIDNDGTVLADFTGPNALHFPAVLNDLDDATKFQLFNSVLFPIVLAKAGVEL